MICYYSVAAETDVNGGSGLEGRRAIFLSVHGGGAHVDPVTRKQLSIQGIIMSYVVPVKQSGEYTSCYHGCE